MECFYIDAWSLLLVLVLPKDIGGSIEKMRLLLGDLVRMNIILLRQLSQGLVSLQSRKSHLSLEGWTVVTSRSPGHLFS